MPMMREFVYVKESKLQKEGTLCSIEHVRLCNFGLHSCCTTTISPITMDCHRDTVPIPIYFHHRELWISFLWPLILWHLDIDRRRIWRGFSWRAQQILWLHSWDKGTFWLTCRCISIPDSCRWHHKFITRAQCRSDWSRSLMLEKHNCSTGDCTVKASTGV